MSDAALDGNDEIVAVLGDMDVKTGAAANN